MAGAPIKHHYIPVFYLKQWAGPDGALYEYKRRYDGLVKARRTYPKGTGYAYGLYTVANVAPNLAQIVESGFMCPADELAARAMQALLKVPSSPALSADVRNGWSRA